MSKATVKSQIRTGSAERFRMPIICNRVGSASALSTSTDWSTFATAIGIAGGQQTPLTRSGVTAFTNRSVSDPLTTVYGSASLPATEVNLSREAGYGHDPRVRPSKVRPDRHHITRRRQLL